MTTNNENLDQGAKVAAPGNSVQEIAAPVRASRRRLTNDGVTKPADLIPAAASADEMANKFSKRRRFIKVGATTVPVALTLTSQPVMAWHCNSTSAWGSGLMQNNTASVQARNQNNQKADECTSLSDWKSNNNSPWCHSALGCSTAKPSKIDSTTTAQFDNCAGWTWSDTKDKKGNPTKVSGTLVGNFNKAKTLTCSSFGINTTLVPGTAKVWDLICNGTKFQQYIAVAMLNEKCFPTTVGFCLKNGKDQQSALASMAKGSFSPVAGVTWNQDQIMSYLYDNWMVR